MTKCKSKQHARAIKASKTKHLKSVSRRKMNKQIRKACDSVRFGRGPNKHAGLIASYTEQVSATFGHTVSKAVQRLSNYTKIFK